MRYGSANGVYGNINLPLVKVIMSGNPSVTNGIGFGSYSIDSVINMVGPDFCKGKLRNDLEVPALVWICDSTDIPNFTRTK